MLNCFGIRALSWIKWHQTVLKQTNKQTNSQSVEFTWLFFSSLKETFKYDSEYWNNTVAYNESSGTSLHNTETKLSSFWSTPFTRLCLGMKYQNETNWIALNYAGSSLREVIGNGTFKETNLTVTEWKKLLNKSTIQVWRQKNKILILLNWQYLSFHQVLDLKPDITFFGLWCTFFRASLFKVWKKKQENFLLTKITTLFITQFTVATARKSKFKIWSWLLFLNRSKGTKPLGIGLISTLFLSRVAVLNREAREFDI